MSHLFFNSILFRIINNSLLFSTLFLSLKKSFFTFFASFNAFRRRKKKCSVFLLHIFSRSCFFFLKQQHHCRPLNLYISYFLYFPCARVHFLFFLLFLFRRKTKKGVQLLLFVFVHSFSTTFFCNRKTTAASNNNILCSLKKRVQLF